MSDNFLYLIPEEPNYIPESKSSELALSLLKSFSDDHVEVKAIVFNEINFIDPGQNFKSVSCPNCGSDISDSWQSLMDASYADKFKDLDILTPCCGTESSLNSLVYKWPAGFAKYVLKAYNPPHKNWLGQSVINNLEKILGCNIRQIKSHI